MSDQPKPTDKWTYEKVAGLLGMSEERSSNYNLVVLRDAINAELEHQLAAAQLAIANHNRDNNNANGTCYKIKADTTALDAALAAAQQPLTECLNWLREELKNDEYYVEKIDIAFAKVKEPQ